MFFSVEKRGEILKRGEKILNKSGKNGQWKKETPCGRIKETTKGENFMSRSYRHIKEYEKEIIELRKQGKTKREICKKYGFTMKQITNFITRYNRNQRRLAAGIALKEKGSSLKDYSAAEQDKIADLKHMLSRKDARIKTLEMENELMRDFLLLAERK